MPWRKPSGAGGGFGKKEGTASVGNTQKIQMRGGHCPDACHHRVASSGTSMGGKGEFDGHQRTGSGLPSDTAISYQLKTKTKNKIKSNPYSRPRRPLSPALGRSSQLSAVSSQPRSKTRPNSESTSRPDPADVSPGPSLLKERGRMAALAQSTDFTSGDRGYWGFFRVNPFSTQVLVPLRDLKATQLSFLPPE